MLLKIAIPIAEGRLPAHFGEAKQFALAEADLSGRKILRSRVVAAPPHEPGSFPRWLREQGVQVMIVGSIGRRALDNLLHHGIEVKTGRPGATVEILLADYLGGKLSPMQDGCDHQHGQTAETYECRLADYLGSSETPKAGARQPNKPNHPHA
jgi:predicted Fe-Mo cluster-binding NifX family protein